MTRRAGDRVRVLSLIDYLTKTGGAERFALGLATHLPQDRIEPWICSTREVDPSVAELLAERGIPHIGLGRRTKLDAYRLAGLAKLLRRERFDILHAQKFGSNVWGTLIGRTCRVPVVIAHEHNWSYSGNRLRVLLDGQLVGRFSTRFIAVSEPNRRRMIEIEGVPAEKVLVMPTGYVPQAGVSDTEIRTELGLAPDALIIGVAAGLRREKALDVLIDAHACVVPRFPAAHLVIAGGGALRLDLEHRVSELGLGGKVHFLGPRDDVDSIMRTADVGAMSSDWEGMPLFAFECMASRTPLVATAVGGLPEIVQDGITGLLVPPRDPVALGDAICTLLADEPLRARMGAAAAGLIDAFTIDVVAVRFADLYEQLAREAGR